MLRFFTGVLCLLLISLIPLLSPEPAYAENKCENIRGLLAGSEFKLINDKLSEVSPPNYTFSFSLNDRAFEQMNGRVFYLSTGDGTSVDTPRFTVASKAFTIPVDYTISNFERFTSPGKHHLTVKMVPPRSPAYAFCSFNYEITPTGNTPEQDDGLRPCFGKITDKKTGQVIAGVDYKYEWGVPPQNDSGGGFTDSEGYYQFRYEGFGYGAGQIINRLTFTKEGYHPLGLNWGKDADLSLKTDCPKDQQMTAIEDSKPGETYICDKGTCRLTQTGETGAFSDIKSCNDDCGIYEVVGPGDCRAPADRTKPKISSGKTEPYYSLNQCLTENPKDTKFCYNREKNVCTTINSGYCDNQPLFNTLKECTAANAAQIEKGLPTKDEIKNSKEACDPKKDPACASATAINCDPATGSTQNVPDTAHGVMTAIGCIPTDPVILINSLIKFSAASGGGIALILMIFGSFKMITSGGNPDNVKKGREQFVAAAMGLLFIIFSVLLLQLIGANILDIPGFN